MQVLLALFLTTGLVLAVTQVVAVEFYLYWIYPWFDIPMHILGGVFVAFGYAMLPFFRIRVPSRFTKLGTYLLVVLVVGIAWEVFEYVNGISVLEEKDFFLDTAMDLVFDLLGGAVGYYLVTRIKSL